MGFKCTKNSFVVAPDLAGELIAPLDLLAGFERPQREADRKG